jgi:glycosyltransferase involved in cell wall biosynthesis
VLRISHSAVVTAWRRREAAMRQLGTRVDLIAARRWNEGGVDVTCSPAPGEPVVRARTWGNHPCGFVYDPRPLWDALRRRAYDVIDIHEEPYSLAAAEVLLLLAVASLSGSPNRRTPVVVYSAQNICKRYPWPVRLLERLVQRKAAGAYACSRGAAEVLRRKGFRGRIDVVPLGIDLEEYRPSSPDGARAGRRGALRGQGDGELAGGDGDRASGDGDRASGDGDRANGVRDDGDGDAGLVVGYAGRLEIRKGILALIDAVAGEPVWSLLIAGDGPDRHRVQQHIAEARPKANVTLLGHLGEDPRADNLADFYRRLDVLAVPSLPTPGWIEQFGRTAIEAMACGVPVVASDTGALSEVVGDGGILVPPGIALALHGALRELADDEGLRRRVAARARCQAQGFSWAEVAARHLALYEAVAQPARPASPEVGTAPPAHP